MIIVVELQIIDTTEEDRKRLEEETKIRAELNKRRAEKLKLLKERRKDERKIEKEFKFYDRIRRHAKKVTSKELKDKAKSMFGNKKTARGYCNFSAAEYRAALLEVLNDKGLMDVEVKLVKREEVKVTKNEEISLL